jgi:carotenoid cleavage dioxygenase-like enzyme
MGIGTVNEGFATVFVPRPGGTAEDDGWVLCQVYDGAANKSFLSVVDGDFSREHARVMIPRALPYLLHGKFVDAGRQGQVR